MLLAASLPAPIEGTISRTALLDFAGIAMSSSDLLPPEVYQEFARQMYVPFNEEVLLIFNSSMQIIQSGSKGRPCAITQRITGILNPSSMV